MLIKKEFALPSRPFTRFQKLFRPFSIIWTLSVFLFHVYLEMRGVFGEKDEARETKLRRQAVRLRERLIRLGPTFIKIGQMLSTRADLLPIPYIDELSKLQDCVPAFPNEIAFKTIEEELGDKPEKIFEEIGRRPIAAASLGQVYRARLKTGQEVAVKVQRPYLKPIIQYDLKVLRSITRMLLRHTNLLKGNDWLGMLDEFERVVGEEMDYAREGRNAERFRSNFAEWRQLHVPMIYWEHTSPRVLTMEYIVGIKVTDLDSLRLSGFSAVEINELMHRAYFKQLLEDGFFHADPHPGNLLVMPDGRLAFFDFGMVGLISKKLQQQMVSAFFHILERDYSGLVDDLISLGFLNGDVELDEFRLIVCEMFKRKIDLDLGEVNFKELAYELGDIIYKYPFTTPSSFSFIMRALMTLEGISIQVNPGFNFMKVAGPYASDFLFRREASQLREQVWAGLREGKSGSFNWGRVFQLAKLGWELWAGPKLERFFGNKPEQLQIADLGVQNAKE